ncbi:PREDICTED: probable leucine-rich repeat receptor-like protein kinase At5g49770 isoform X3 [Populus euphratica]|uniref:non-specific serine/threonine protein kinase n=1 Tax=Populus euphratica TaxID=75702 RepID=A0AAJ6XRR6_POPEU|nr:PREDICTED: probable leucine-rich repeat receptor-like protein kinase At5g49770 isoform X3 [Populus euphratica]
MGSRILVFLVVALIQVCTTPAVTNNDDFNALKALKDIWENVPPSWVGSDPCGSRWDGILCTNSRVTSITLASMGLKGTLSGDISNLSELQILDLSYNPELSGPLPPAIGDLKKLTSLILVSCRFSGPIPDTIGSLPQLTYLDMSNNSFEATDFPPWFSTLQSLTTLVMETTQLQGQIPSDFFSLSNLQTVDARNNQLNGTLDIGTSTINQLSLIDLRKNKISGFTNRPGVEKVGVILVDNPVCQETGVTERYCSVPQTESSYSTPLNNCVASLCFANQISSPNCKCAFPYTGLLKFRAPSFSNLENNTYYTVLEKSLMNSFKLHQLPVDSVNLSHPRKDSSTYLVLNLQVFPFGQDRFNRTGISSIGFVLSNQTFKPPSLFGPFFFIGDAYLNFAGEVTGSKKSSNTGVIIGAVAGGSVLLLLLLGAGLYAHRQKKRAEKATEQNNPFAQWESNMSIGGVPQLKGARNFSFEELRKYSNNFSETNDIGSGGYGNVYRGVLPTGELIAIKRAQQGSMQGGLEFKTEIELLSRVHHKNVVSLLGFCFDRGEQMLVYEFVPNGSLMESLSGKTGIRLDWVRRLKVALGAARGLAYLHELANPPIIHRDIKSSNILLDERLNAKVADFGLSKPMGDSEKGHLTHVTTQVKGTMGYMDPEYYMTQQLTEKSDVYSFGVVMLELLTGKRPIEKGKYVVREVKTALDRAKYLYNLGELLDSSIGLDTTLKGLDKFVDVALKCVEENGSDRPTMGEVVKEIENILQLAGLNPNADSASTSASYDDASKGNAKHPYIFSKDAFDYSGGFPVAKVEPL